MAHNRLSPEWAVLAGPTTYATAWVMQLPLKGHTLMLRSLLVDCTWVDIAAVHTQQGHKTSLASM